MRKFGGGIVCFRGRVMSNLCVRVKDLCGVVLKN